MQTNLFSLRKERESVVDSVMDPQFRMHVFEPPYLLARQVDYAIRKMPDGSLQIWEVNGMITLDNGKQDYKWIREAPRKLHS